MAQDEDGLIGIGNKLPWHLPGELKHFRDLTTKTKDPHKNNIVIMGRKTWESLPEKFRPLPNRINAVLSANPYFPLPSGCILADGFGSLFKLLEQPQWKSRFESVFVIGGAGVYSQAMTLPNCEKLFITHVCQTFPCDAFFPSFADFKKTAETSRQNEGEIEYFFAEYSKKTLS